MRVCEDCDTIFTVNEIYTPDQYSDRECCPFCGNDDISALMYDEMMDLLLGKNIREIKKLKERRIRYE